MAKYEIKGFTFYHESHTWVRKMADGSYKVGISDYAQQQQGAIVYADLPEEGDTITFGEVFGSIESSKAVSDLVAPISGKIVSVNEEVLDEPSVLNDSCYDGGWILSVEPDDYEADRANLLNADGYRAFIATLE